MAGISLARSLSLIFHGVEPAVRGILTSYIPYLEPGLKSISVFKLIQELYIQLFGDGMAQITGEPMNLTLTDPMMATLNYTYIDSAQSIFVTEPAIDT